MAFVFSAKDGSGDITDDGGKIVQFKTAEDAASWAEQNGVDPDVFDIDEVDFAKEREEIASKLPQEIEQARQQQIAEDQANEPWFKTLGKQALRATVPYSVEGIEKTGKVSTMAPVVDLVNAGTMTVTKPIQMLGSGIIRTLGDIYQQQEAGTVDPTRTAVVSGLNFLPMASGKIPQGEFLKNRAAGQLYNSILPNKVARQGYNPITTDALKSKILENKVIPIISRESRAFDEMADFTSGKVSQLGNERTEAARDITDKMSLSNRYNPEKFHMEAVPVPQETPSIIPFLSKEELSNQGKMANYAKQVKKWDRSEFPTYMEKPEPPALIENPKDYLYGNAVSDWTLEKVIEKPLETFRGAYQTTRHNIQQKYKNDKVTGNSVLKELDDWANGQGILSGKSHDISAKKASQIVTDLNKNAETFNKMNAGKSAYGEARMEMATAINKEIERVSPELRQQSREIGKWMALKQPIVDRASANTVKSSVGSGIRSELSRMVNRSPQGAQLQYNIGKSLLSNSPILRAGIELSRQGTLADKYSTK